ncbi:MAG: Mut7-C RNAse domain-containing protein [Candidatus Micrarchaeia archaeon]
MFVADVMLKKLARWLRLLGVEVLYPPSVDDDKIIEFAKEKNKILLTMDSDLCKRARKQGVRVFLMPRRETDEQLALLVRRFKINLSNAPSTVFCPLCNGTLKQVGRKEVKKTVPEEIVAKHEVFWMCRECKKVFWEGSHWEKINRKLEVIREMVKR